MSVQDAKQILFQDSLADVVRQMRNSRKGEQETIQEALADIRSELKSTAQHVKVTAVVKLTYFAMLGYPGDYGAFNIIEVMADQNFQHKRAGYVAAAIILNDTSPVLPLTTALLKRDMMSANPYEVGLALYCLSSVCTPDLARDLVSDVVGLLSSPRAVIRKKAVLCLYKIFLQFPEALRPTYPLLKDKLEDGSDKSDSDPAVRGAVVNVLCELARRNPANFLNLVPPFYSLLSSIHNNWTLIKVIKVFGYFAPLEPRLGKKLVDPLTNIITTTNAKSVQYECIFAVANGMSKVSSLTKLAVDRMKVFAEDRDANLKYLGLDAMSRIMREAPKQLADQRETVLRCLADRDPTIRVKALTILQGMVTKKNLVATVNSMFDNVALSPPDEDWSNRVIHTILDTITDEDYANVQDFEWYLAVLMDLAQLPMQSFKHGERIETEFVNVVTRVNAVRQFGVESMASLLSSGSMLAANTSQSTQWCIVRGAAFLCGEYPYWLTNKALTVAHLLSDRIQQMPATLQATAVSAVSKIFAFAVRPCERHMARRDGEEELQDPQDATTLRDIINAIAGANDSANTAVTAQTAPLTRGPTRELTMKLSGPISPYCLSIHPVVQERALLLRYMVTAHATAASSDAAPADGVPFQVQFFAAEVEPVAEGAQEAVTMPEEVDLETPFCDTLPDLIDSDDDSGDSDDESDDGKGVSVEAALRAEKERQAKRRSDMDSYYLKSGSTEVSADADLPPIESVDLGKTVPSRHRASGQKHHTITKTLSKPANYVSPTGNRRGAGTSDEPVDELAARLRHISVDRPVGKDEVLPTIQPYKRIEASASPARGSAAAAAAAAADEAEVVLETKRQGASRHYQPVQAVDENGVSLAVQVVESKVKKDGSVVIHMLCTVRNNIQGHALYNPTVRLAESEVTRARLQNAEGAAVDEIPGGEKLKTDASFNAEFALVLAGGIPDMTSPIAFEVRYAEKKKDKVASGSFPLLCKYFMTQADAKLPPADFASSVLPSLEAANVVAASIPVDVTAVLADSVVAIRNSLRLSTVETYRDCVSLWGSMVQRKKAEATHVAVLLKEESDEEAGRQLLVSVKCTDLNLANGIIGEISSLLGGEIEAEE
jgi:AP-3 complex subunit delta-1